MQVASRSGPCFDAFRSGDLIVSDDLEAEDRWPEYRGPALEEGLGYILNWRALQESRTLAEQLQHPLVSRVVIEQAKGMVAARHDVGPGEAFELLRRRARSTSTRLHEICRQVVEGELDL